AAAFDPLRQRRAVRLAGSGWIDPAVGVVAEAGNQAAVHSPRIAAGERSTRADASHAEGADVAPAGGECGRPAASVRCVPSPLQRRAAARGAETTDAGGVLRRIAAIVAGPHRGSLV